MRLRHASIVFLCSALLASGPAFAESRPLTVRGRPGVWFPRADADRLRDVVERKLPAAHEVIRTQELLLALQATQIRTSTTALAVSSTIAASNLQLATTLQQAFEEEAGRGSRDLVWFSGGTVLGVALGVVVTLLVRR